MMQAHQKQEIIMETTTSSTSSLSSPSVILPAAAAAIVCSTSPPTTGPTADDDSTNSDNNNNNSNSVSTVFIPSLVNETSSSRSSSSSSSMNRIQREDCEATIAAPIATAAAMVPTSPSSGVSASGRTAIDVDSANVNVDVIEVSNNSADATATATATANTAAVEATPSSDHSPAIASPATSGNGGATTATVIMPSNEELLLREWAASPDHHATATTSTTTLSASASASASMSATSHEDDEEQHHHNHAILMPPVAPAVVLNETSEGSSNSNSATPRVYSYPVATFVSNFVRSSVNELRDHIMASPISIYAATAVPDEEGTGGDATTLPHHARNNNLSARSAPGSMMTPVSTAATAAAATSSQRQQQQRDNEPRFLDGDSDGDDGGAEYVLIDGDLVAIPAIHERYMDDYEYTVGRGRQRRQQQQQQRRRFSRHSSSAGTNSNNNNNNNQAQHDNDDDDDDDDDDEDHSSQVTSDIQQQQQQQQQRGQQHHDDDDDEDDDTSDDFIHRHQNRMMRAEYTQSSPDGTPLACRPNHSRMHRGVRKVKKWMKRKNLLPRRGAWHKQHHQQHSPPSSQLTLETDPQQSGEGIETTLVSPRHAAASAGAELSDSLRLEDGGGMTLASASSSSSLMVASAAAAAAGAAAAPLTSIAASRPPLPPPEDESFHSTEGTRSIAGKKSPLRGRKDGKRKKNLRLAWMRDIESKNPQKPQTNHHHRRESESWSKRASLQQQQQQQQPNQQTPQMQRARSLGAPPAASAVSSSSARTLDTSFMPPSQIPAVASLPAAAAATGTSSTATTTNTAEPLTLDSLPATSLDVFVSHHNHHRTPSNSSITAFAAEANASLLLSPELQHPPPPHHHHETPSLNRQASIAAEYVGYVGSEDQLLQAGVLPDNIMAAEVYIEDRMDDYDKYDKKDDGYMLRSMVPRDADFKVDKQEAPCVDLMLRRAGEFAQDLGPDEDNNHLTAYAVAPPPRSLQTAGKGKSDGESVPLSIATVKDVRVHNDILKLVMVGDARVDKTALARSLRQSSKKARKKRTTLGVDVHSWTPPNDDHVRFTIWDVQGASVDASPYDCNFGAHPGTQALFFSDRSLYLLVWDLAASNRKTYRRKLSDGDDSEDEDFDDEDEEDENEYLREEANRQADRALQSDIEDRVLTWLDCIGRRGPHSAILPVAMVAGNMSPEEAKRRCDTMQTLMMEHTERMENAPKVLSGAETVLCVSLDTNMGMDLLQATILAIATDANHSVFDHVGTPVPLGTTMVLETVRRLKQDHKLVLVDHLLAELSLLKGEAGIILSVEEVMEALHFLSSIGEVLYFGGMDDVLSHYVILSRKWLVSALSCILRNDLKRELTETRRFMNMQCLYSDQQFPENPVTQTFTTSTSNCPLLSSSDTQMLWQSMSFMREAADMSSQLQEANPTTNSTMFGFLEHLLVHTGVFLPLDIDRFASPDVVYFVPSLLAQSNSRDVWTYKSSEAWMTTLAHSWLFRDGADEFLMEHVTVALLRDLYEFSHVVAAKAHSPPPRAQTFPFAQQSMTDFMDNHDGEAIGHIKIHQMMCWKNSLLIKIGCIFPDGNELRESFVEIFVTVADPSSPHCVASDAMRANMQRLIVSAKGQVGHHGRKLWRGGYNIVLDSIKASVADCTNVDLQVVCPECLAHQNSSSASTWSWDSVRAAAETGSAIVRCMRGHRVDSNLICGTVKAAGPKTDGLHSLAEAPKKPVKDLLPSVVLVALWDPKTNSVKNVGSGFIADKKQGLVVTAGHILFEMEEGRQFGTPYFGLKDAKVVIGLIPEDKTQNNDNRASFRYFAEIVADDIHSMDACVLRITTRFDRDLDDETLIAETPEKGIDLLHDEHLPILKMTRRYELEESVRILGFNQAGEGWLEQGKHVNRSADFAKGYICKQFKLTDANSESDSDDSSSSAGGFSPREEIVCVIPTIPGHSGGPCVNEEGRVVGILSRADPVDRQRCYLVPSSELKILVNKAKKTSSRVAGLKLSY